ncbi:hypothetical protein BC835DRAFT_261627 [Cytidiella melzeri]|nr:hypothetical protein BC835DRAFT_261627 [Cytidiella melzeri]
MEKPANTPSLSNEITARIIEFLFHDAESLKSCSLTCSSFLYPARKHLFYHVYIHFRNCTRFLQLLDANRHLGVHVRELHLVASNPMEQEETWVDKYLPLLAPQLPNTIHLELKGQIRYKAAPFQGFQSIKRLSIIRTQVNNLDDFCDLYGMFPLLEETFFHDIFVYRITTEAVTITAQNPSNSIKWTQFNSCRIDPGQYVDWVLQTDLYRNMERFGVCPLQHVGVAPTGRLVAGYGPALKHFKLALVGMVAQGGFVEPIRSSFRLDQNPNLRTVEFGSPAQYADLYGSDDIAVSWFPMMLSTIVSTVVEEVTFNLWGGKDDVGNPDKTGDLEMIDNTHWDDIVDILSGAPFIGLKRLVFHVSGKGENAVAIVEAVKKRFSRFDEMGVLMIDDRRDPDCA